MNLLPTIVLTLISVLQQWRVRGPMGVCVPLTSQADLKETYSITLLTSTTAEPPVFLHHRTDSNTAVDFLGFVLAAILAGYLGRGDVLVLDNASVHKMPDVLRNLLNIFAEEGLFSLFITYPLLTSSTRNSTALHACLFARAQPMQAYLWVCQGTSTS